MAKHLEWPNFAKTYIKLFKEINKAGRIQKRVVGAGGEVGWLIEANGRGQGGPERELSPAHLA